jgi:hypothetical protein
MTNTPLTREQAAEAAEWMRYVAEMNYDGNSWKPVYLAAADALESIPTLQTALAAEAEESQFCIRCNRCAPTESGKLAAENAALAEFIRSHAHIEIKETDADHPEDYVVLIGGEPVAYGACPLSAMRAAVAKKEAEGESK